MWLDVNEHISILSVAESIVNEKKSTSYVDFQKFVLAAIFKKHLLL
jgi:hypothetical protein